jgi:hypothetical protein
MVYNVYCCLVYLCTVYLYGKILQIHRTQDSLLTNCRLADDKLGKVKGGHWNAELYAVQCYTCITDAKTQAKGTSLYHVDASTCICNGDLLA